MDLELAREIAIPDAPGKIILLVADGLGGLPHPRTGRSELETARTPDLDGFARDSMCGLSMPVGPGVTPGSGPGHLSLFGYDPVRYNIGRGALEAVGIDFDLGPSDLAVRGNFCTVDGEGRLVDRRAGRIPSEQSFPLVDRLATIRMPGVEVIPQGVREYRFVVVFRGEGLADGLSGTDPQKTGVPPLTVRAEGDDPAAEATARLVNDWIAKARELLKDEPVANMVILRGFSKYPALPQLRDVWGLNAAAIAEYPMYRGLAKLAGMTALPSGNSFAEEIAVLRENYDKYDFFFLHYKYTDAAGEDGDFDRKVEMIEKLDAALPEVMKLNPDVMMIGGDHSTPSVLAAHSWHPVPFAMKARWSIPDDVRSFSERDCARGIFGVFPAQQALPVAMAHAGRFAKYGA